jgi:hypothetical protein
MHMGSEIDSALIDHFQFTFFQFSPLNWSLLLPQSSFCMNFENVLWCYPLSFSFTLQIVIACSSSMICSPKLFHKLARVFLLITFSWNFPCHVQWRTNFRKAMNKADNDASTKAIDSLINYEVSLCCLLLLVFFSAYVLLNSGASFF